MIDDTRKIIYVGNRGYILKRILAMNLNVIHVLVMKDSYLQRMVLELGVRYTVLESKGHFLSVLAEEKFDL